MVEWLYIPLSLLKNYIGSDSLFLFIYLFHILIQSLSM